MQTHYTIGIMSGTSTDGADAVLASFCGNKIQVVDQQSAAYPDDIKSALQKIYHEPIKMIELGSVHTQLAQFYSDITLALLERHHDKHIEVIGCHGQTIYHQPKGPLPFSLQIGNAALLCEKTQTPVVSDFRSQDIALGGQGAPLVPPFHYALFKQHAPAAVINIGGIANITFLDNDIEQVFGYDCGPGNTLIDLISRQDFNCAYDNKGKLARQGNCHEKLLYSMLKDSYFSQKIPKSTGLEYFNASWLQDYLTPFASDNISKQDLLTTLTHFTAQTISDALTRMNIQQAIICGGGAYNDYLIELITQKSDLKISRSDDFAIAATHIEACAFAWLAWRRINHLPGTLKTGTGASHNAMTGCLYLPSTTR